MYHAATGTSRPLTALFYQDSKVLNKASIFFCILAFNIQFKQLSTSMGVSNYIAHKVHNNTVLVLRKHSFLLYRKTSDIYMENIIPIRFKRNIHHATSYTVGFETKKLEI